VNRQRRRRLAFPAGRARSEDAGSALMLSVNVMAVALSLGLTVGLTAVTTSRASGIGRQRTSLVAAAESGVDFVHAQLDEATTGWPCTSPQTLPVTGGSDPSTVTVTLEYLAADGSPTACDSSPVAVLVRSRAVAARSLAGEAPAGRTMLARFALNSSGSAATTMQAVFGQGGVTAINTFDVYASTPGALDAEVYTNTGAFSCQASGTIEGPIVTQLDVHLRNACSAKGTVWTAGRFTADPSSTIAGDVYAATTTAPGIAIDNGTRIAGNAFANADVTLGNGSVGGSVLSTQGSISFGNGGHIDGSAYARLGLSYTTGSGGSVARDVVASAGSIGAGGVNPWWIGGNATASPSGCVTDTVTVGGTASPAGTANCWLPSSPLTPTVPFPATPDNPSGVPTPALPATVAAPPYRPFPALYARTVPSTGQDALDAWRATGWDVHVFSGSGADTQPCTDAVAYLKSVRPGGANHAAWVAKPLAIVIQGCTSGLYWDQNNRELLAGSTWTLYNDLAVISDHGIGNWNSVDFASDSTTRRRMMWIVPTDSPFTIGAPSCTPWTGDLTPNNVRTTGVSWFLYTPCAISPQNSFGSSGAPVNGAMYGGTVTVSNAWLTFVPMQVPGLGGGTGGGRLTAMLTYKREIGA
jgi:hypothetical protein